MMAWPSLRVLPPFQLGDPFERTVPARFELGGDETVVRVHGVVASLGERHLVVGLLQLQRQRAMLVGVVLLREVAGLDRRLERPALDHGQDRGAHRLVGSAGAKAEAARGGMRAGGCRHW